MKDFLESEASGIIVVARLPADIQKHLGAKTTRLFLSSETRDSHGHHRWTSEGFSLLNDILAFGEVRSDRARHVVAAYFDENWWIASLKVTADLREVYLLTFHRSNERQIRKFRKIPEIIRSVTGRQVAVGEGNTPHGPEGYPASLTDPATCNEK